MLKKTVFISIYILFAFFILVGCSSKHPPLPTVKQVDINKYKGTWYEIARFEHFFEEGCKNVTATYELNDDETIKVINRCTDIETNKKKEATGVAYAKDTTNSKLRVSFFRPFYGDYWILELAPDYSYVAVGNPNRDLLWILSRTKTLDSNIKNELTEKLKQKGFDTDKFIWTIQE